MLGHEFISPFQWATFAVASLGAIIAVLSLGWSIESHFREGARIKVDLKLAILQPMGYVSVDLSQTRNNFGMSGIEGPLLFCVEVRNIGRLGAQIGGISLCTDKLSIVSGTVNPSPQLPTTIAAGASSVWFYEVDVGLALCETSKNAGGTGNYLSAKVTLGSGSSRRSSRMPLGRIQESLRISASNVESVDTPYSNGYHRESSRR